MHKSASQNLACKKIAFFQHKYSTLMACKMPNKLNDLMAMVRILFVAGDGEQ